MNWNELSAIRLRSLTRRFPTTIRSILLCNRSSRPMRSNIVILRTVLTHLNSPRLSSLKRNGRNAVYFSSEDLSVGLVGEPVDGIVGYEPDLATRLMERMILASAPQ